MYRETVFVLFVWFAAPAVTRAQDFAIDWHTIDGGGGTSAGGALELSGTVGQPDAAELSTGGDWELTGGFWAGVGTPAGAPIQVVSIETCAVHDLGGPNETELCLTDTATDVVEPRRSGPTRLLFDADGEIDGGTVNSGNVQVNCANQTPVYTVSLDGPSTIAVVLTAPMTDIDCCTFAFAGVQSVDGGPLEGSGQLAVLAGDLNGSGGVTGADPSLVKPHFGESLGTANLSAPQWDFDRNGAVTGADYSLIKPLLGHIAPACP